MSVYTPLTLEEIQHLAQQYQYHQQSLDIQKITPIHGGVENTNYFLTDQKQQQFVLTVYEALSYESVEQLIQILVHLSYHQLPVAVPLELSNPENNASHFLLQIHDKPVQIAPRLSGRDPEQATLSQVEAIGEAMAKMHLHLMQYSQRNPNLNKENQHSQKWWEQRIQDFSDHFSEDEKQTLDFIVKQIHQLQSQSDLPKGLIHADLFRDNTLFQNEELTAILDFAKLCHDELLLDICICMNDFCTDFPSVALNEEKAQAFLKAYQQIRPLTEDEKYCFPAYLAMAGSRFWISRLETKLRNEKEHRISQDILQKDPNEMRDLFFDRLKRMGDFRF